MSELHYLYCFAWVDCSVASIDQAVDDRFGVERVLCPPIAAIASQVGPDRFPVAKLQEETTDINWLGQVAMRHNAIVNRIARHHPILPLRLGTLFQSRSSLFARTVQCAPTVAEFLRSLENRQEWAVKLYLDEDRTMSGHCPVAGGPTCHSSLTSPRSSGTQYFVAKRLESERHRQLRDSLRQELLAAESCLERLADSWRRLRPLSATLTGRSEKMVWNAAFLLRSNSQAPFRAACEHLRTALDPKGLILEVTGPWAPYHFCPKLAG